MNVSAKTLMAPRQTVTNEPAKKAVVPDKILREKQIEEQKRQEKKEEDSGVVVEISEDLRKMYQEQLEASKEAAKKAGEGMQEMAKIIEIARRIARGDHVPPGDEKKLMEFDKDLYQMAKASASLYANRKHKKYDSLFEEEDAGQEEKVRELRREKRETQAVSEAETEGELSEITE